MLKVLKNKPSRGYDTKCQMVENLSLKVAIYFKNLMDSKFRIMGFPSEWKIAKFKPGMNSNNSIIQD